MVMPSSGVLRQWGYVTTRRPRAHLGRKGTRRLIGSIRRECLDHVVFGEAHLRRILAGSAAYYNNTRTHLSLNKDSPSPRPAQRLSQQAHLLKIETLTNQHRSFAHIRRVIDQSHQEVRNI
jgi:transposase InsO family protein